MTDSENAFWRREKRQRRRISPIILSNIWQSAAFVYINKARKAAEP